MKLSICIVNFKTPELTIRCVRSIRENTEGIDYEIIIVDNASNDGSVALFKKEFGDSIILIKNETNRFFSGGFNDALCKAQGDYSLIINSDSYVKDNSIRLMAEFLDKHDEVGGVEGTTYDDKTNKITATSSKELTLFREYVRSYSILKAVFGKTYNQYVYMGWDRTTDKQVDVVCNAFFMVRTKLMKDIGYFSEAMKLYFTEDYICDRIRQKRYTLWHLGTAIVHHSWCSSTAKQKPVFIKCIYKSDRMVYFALKIGKVVLFP